MLNHSRIYSVVVGGVVGSVIVVEALINPFKQESFCIANREPDLPVENFSYSPLPHAGIVAATTSGSGYMVSS